MPKAALVRVPGIEVAGRFASRPFAFDRAKLGTYNFTLDESEYPTPAKAILNRWRKIFAREH